MNFYTNSLFYPDSNNERLKIALAYSFPFFTILALWIDSVPFQTQFFDGRWITNVLSVLFFSFLFLSANSELRKLLFVMVFLSFIGELIFCSWLHLYDYKTEGIPLYVPFGHAIVYGTGFILAEISIFKAKPILVRKGFVIFYAFLFISVGIILNDLFSILFGVLFFALIWRKRWQNVYFFIALCVIFIEIFGTYFKCWAWNPIAFGGIPTANPPMGAVFFYAGGDVLLAKIVTFWKKGVDS